ncbi:hypothetical protein SKAU_G00286300 [Synaphobranchus kaupii]|uniref:EPS8 spectrin-like domain-containing protein n=1 Tax=Synaphobranchus kaupii TaxID=118154 RepID=A0A9Q1INH9_SYNKA|nr:hypothetical protein SKAU_G00286300 [Synaphobranchus kaupii]
MMTGKRGGVCQHQVTTDHVFMLCADDLLTLRARPPSEEEFTDIFQKFKYSFSLLDRLKSSIVNPNSEELLHHIFIPLDLIVKTTGGPALGAGVSSPALTGGAVTLLQGSLTEEEKHLWTALGPNWTLSRSVYLRL